MTLEGLLVRKPGETQLVPYEDGSLLAGGSMLAIPAEFHTQCKRGESKAAVILDVIEGDVLRSERLVIRCEVEPYFQVEGEPIDFGDIKPGEVPSATAIVRTCDGSRVALARSQACAPGFIISRTAVAPDQEGRAAEWRFEFSPDGTVGSGLASANLTWTSDACMMGEPDRFHSFFLQPKYRVLSPVEVSAPHVSFGLIKPTQAVLTRTVTLRATMPSLDPMSLVPRFERTLGQPASWSDGVRMRVLPGSVEGEAVLEIELPPRPVGANGAFRGRVILDSPSDAVPPIEVCFSGVCRR